ncbi:MAG TPA: hypothetical protein VFU21_08100 [Kofleriaceae bacterium]|nr:hypothetical protein [Kofleriaceae bacterium]
MGTWGSSLVVLVAALAAAPGCSTIGPGAGDDDDDVAQPDAAPAGPDAAVPLGPFGEPRVIEALSDPGANDDDPTVTGDLLELVFNSNRTGNSQLFVSRRESVDQPWGDPDPIPELNTGDSETAPELSTDGLAIYFSSNRPGGKGGQDIYIARRDSRDAAWDPPELVPELNSGSGDYSPVEDDSGLVIYFYSNRDGGDQDLFVATRLSRDDPWRLTMRIDELATDGNDADPFVTADGLALYFGTGPAGALDIHLARRLDRDAAFDPADPVAELNSDAQDTDPWLSPAGRYVVFMSERTGDAEIYESDR